MDETRHPRYLPAHAVNILNDGLLYTVSIPFDAPPSSSILLSSPQSSNGGKREHTGKKERKSSTNEY